MKFKNKNVTDNNFKNGLVTQVVKSKFFFFFNTWLRAKKKKKTIILGALNLFSRCKRALRITSLFNIHCSGEDVRRS